MRGRLSGKRCLIVGGTSGIGLAAAQRFLDEGATVMLAVLPWRVRRPAPAAAAAATRLGPGAHRVDRGTFLLDGPADVTATGTARVIVPPGSAARVAASGYAEVDRRGGEFPCGGTRGWSITRCTTAATPACGCTWP